MEATYVIDALKEVFEKLLEGRYQRLGRHNSERASRIR
jgi:hypothetical protein